MTGLEGRDRYNVENEEDEHTSIAIEHPLQLRQILRHVFMCLSRHSTPANELAKIKAAYPSPDLAPGRSCIYPTQCILESPHKLCWAALLCLEEVHGRHRILVF